MFFNDFFGGGMGGGMPGMGGFPGGMGGMPSRPKGDTTKLYKVLGVDKKAKPDEIKKAYRTLARKHHPDRPSGNAEKFKEVQSAYDVLSDPDKRRAYDQTGDPNADPRMIQKKPKDKSTKFELEVPMAQFYSGHTRRIRVTKTVLCETCDGEGGSSVTVCSTCRGRGIRIIDRRIGPNMVQRMQAECDVCDGKGKVVPPSAACRACSGGGTKKASSVLNVNIGRGMRHGDKIVFNEEGDHHPDMTPGDVVVILKKPARPHKTFTRSKDGCHLTIKKKISLIEALAGFKFNVEHLDGRTLEIKSRPNFVYTSGIIDAVREEGMPIKGDPTTRGNLYIEVDVQYPTNLTDAQKERLKKILGPPPAPPIPLNDDEEKVEQVVLENVDIAAEKAAYAKLMADNPSQYDEDDDEGHHGGAQQMACQTQ